MLTLKLPQNINFIFYEIDIIGVFEFVINLRNLNRPQFPINLVPGQIDSREPPAA